jgi:outer membrane protein
MDMKKVYIYTTLCFLLSYASAEAQQAGQALLERETGTAIVTRGDDKQMTKRTLAECIQLAVKVNPTLLQNELDVKRADVNLAQAKANRLPDVNASLQHSLTSGRSQDNSTLQYISSNNSTGNFSLGASLPLFRGFRLFNEIRMSADAKTAGKLTFDTQINALKLDVITAYIQSLTAQYILRQS